MSEPGPMETWVRRYIIGNGPDSDAKYDRLRGVAQVADDQLEAEKAKVGVLVSALRHAATRMHVHVPTYCDGCAEVDAALASVMEEA